MCVSVAALNGVAIAPLKGDDDSTAGQSLRLFNGRNLDDWYVYTAETKNDNPGVFQVIDNMIHVSGGKEDVGYFGGLITKQPYENYRLRLEYK